MTFRMAAGLALITLAGSASAQQSGPDGTAIANPAAVFCVERGGSF